MAVSACSPPESSVIVCGFLPGGRARISRPGLERIVGFDQLQLGRAAAEQMREQPLEMAVDDVEGGEQPLAALAVEALDRLAQLADRLDHVLALGDDASPAAPTAPSAPPRRAD